MSKRTKYEKNQRILERHRIIDSLEEKEEYIVRLYDRFDNLWIDITKNVSKQEAVAEWDEKTKNGIWNTKYEDGDYYCIFQSNTRMIFS